MKDFIKKHLFFFCLFFTTVVSAEDYYSNSNKSLFIMPRDVALGSAALTFSRDALMISNPANIPMDSSSVLSISYSGFYENALSTSLISFITRFNNNIGLGISSGYLYIPDILNTTNFEIDDETEEPIYDPSRLIISSSSEIFINISLGYRFQINPYLELSLGGRIHSMRRRLIDWIGYGIGVDIGTTLALRKPGLHFSVLIDDISTNYIHWSSEYQDNGLAHIRIGIGWCKELPYMYGKVSIMYKSPDLLSNEGVGFNFMSEKADNITEPQNHNIKDEPLLIITSGCYGLEYLIQKTVALRLGFDETKRIFFGSGLSLFSQALLFDFAYMVPNDLPGTYSLSIGFRW